MDDVGDFRGVVQGYLYSGVTQTVGNWKHRKMQVLGWVS